jgi:ankyrin repeat protein
MPLKARKLRKAAQKAKRTFRLLKSIVEEEIIGKLTFKSMKTAAEHAFAEKWRPERLGKKIIEQAMITSHDVKYIEELLWQGADIDTRDRRGFTALMYAAANGRTELCEFLLGHNANIEARAPKGSTPLILATMNGQVKTVEALLKHGARIDARNDFGDSAYDIAKICEYDYSGVYTGRSNPFSGITISIYNFSMKTVEKMIQQDVKELFEPQFFACTNSYPSI